jgi:hypothetical protein
MKTVTAAVEQRIENNEKPILLVKIEFTSVTVYLTTAGHDISWDSNTWLANGFIVEEPENSQHREMRTTSDDITLTGVDQSIVAIILTESQTNRVVTVYEAFVDDDGGVVPDPYIRDVYFIDQTSTKQGIREATVGLTLAGEFADFDYRAGIRTTMASHQRIHPNDQFFRYSTDVKRQQLWGGDASTPGRLRDRDVGGGGTTGGNVPRRLR